MYKREQFTGRRLSLAVIDAGCAFGTAMLWLRGASREAQLLLGMILVLATIILLALSGAYFQVARKPLAMHRYFTALAAGCAVLVSKVTLLFLGIMVPVATLVCGAMALFVALLGIRVLLLQAHRYFVKAQRLWVVAEDMATAQVIAEKAAKHGALYAVVACSGVRELDDISKRLQDCDAVLCTPGVSDLLKSACSQFGKELMLVPGPSEVMLATAGVHQVDDLLVLSVSPLRLSGLQRFWKRALDVAGAATLLMLAMPIMLLLYFFIPLESPGAALFRQERRGWRGRSFEVLKFRTMLADAERTCGPVFAAREDPRITRLGQWLRAMRLDELPQLWNVLRGDMSLVGPRPEREFFARQFDRELPDYPLRTIVKPGLTGLAQVWGSYSTSAESKLRLDLMYIANYSLAMDLHLLLHTVRVVLQREQAAGVPSGSALPFGLQPGMRGGEEPQ